MFATCTPRRSISSAGMTTTAMSARPARDELVVLLARGRGEQLRVGQPVEPPGVAGPQHARGDDERPGTRAPAGLVHAGDRPEAVSVQCRLQRPGPGRAADDGPRRTPLGRQRRAAGDRAVIAGGPSGPPGAAAGPAPALARRRRSTDAAGAGRQPSAPGSPSRTGGHAHRVVCGSTAAILPNRSNGITIIRARPITFEIGTAPWPGTRESAELFRESPIIHSSPAGTVTGPNGACRAGPPSGR